jgi:hypothetical protein
MFLQSERQNRGQAGGAKPLNKTVLVVYPGLEASQSLPAQLSGARQEMSRDRPASSDSSERTVLCGCAERWRFGNGGFYKSNLQSKRKRGLPAELATLVVYITDDGTN